MLHLKCEPRQFDHFQQSIRNLIANLEAGAYGEDLFRTAPSARATSFKAAIGEHAKVLGTLLKVPLLLKLDEGGAEGVA